MMQGQGQGRWLSILEYAGYRKISISTIRRYIKDKRVKVEERSGKYFIWVEKYLENELRPILTNDNLAKDEMEQLRKENQLLKEELEDLRMLLKIYERERFDRMDSRSNKEISPPEIPLA
ncbi:MAG: hypothetical protein A2504_06580 [Bdellovibrionales bacterium RIFOXYD12_FULL_39_22]|nr:MAG: hypothetical protein A2385_08900 [Bdellovibrionales bacterium RIFOXYB1_FULL_39_21]OFZ45182.1 MAG: hypothetical protein A2485_05635 [Bdellovibrionales bacterium RIFOXYC12_FULL_39_17]OFZ45626.1 MAG: hypothetical protein A2404_03480 [Bdellovibrionales bacterium RIFOXYC1_FULL_39_130]OFZ70513.1 MAG: hypothetical protein A2451_05290 [Bdellovibrionales bacterium RIFOXYC2_FULL_39_8]OFZ77488.1 MAG: hypothetical protein A2560_09070 [Bdellovibrionales bacterium RIFOXYD1_FULL_39_84]OFZ91617.1 MAG: